jgi:Holliday junction DNA helicase RuvA
MISYLQGKVLHAQSRNLILDVNSIGYEVFAPESIINKTETNAKLTLFIHSHIREDQISLFGFETLDDRDFFRLLISVSGIGPKTALEFFAEEIAQVKNAIFNEDEIFLSKFSGIGKKTAARIILDLKSKIEFSPQVNQSKSSTSEFLNDAISALESLGYRKNQIIRVFADKPQNIQSTEEAVSYFLKSV